MERAETADRLLGGKVTLAQPRDGYRVAIDPVFLAASVPAQAGQHIVDLGTGAGAAALCLAWRVPGSRLTGIENQKPLAEFARQNAQANGLVARFKVEAIDLLDLAHQNFVCDHVMANPPYLAAGRATPSPHAERAAATMEGRAKLADWITCAYRILGPRGTVTFIHRADRLPDLVKAMDGLFGSLRILPLTPKRGRTARRVIVQGVKDDLGERRMLAGLILHQDNGQFTPEAEAVLRNGAAIDLGRQPALAHQSLAADLA